MNTNKNIDDYIANLGDWRGAKIAHFRDMIHQACPDLQEDWKWAVPVFMGKGPVIATSAFKDHIKVNFFEGAQLTDTHGIFNSGLDSKKHRSVNLGENDSIDEAALTALMLEAAAIDLSKRVH